MISAKEALRISQDNDVSRHELSYLEAAIKDLANSGNCSLYLSTGLTSEAKAIQDAIFPNFKGRLSDSTIRTLGTLGYTITKHSNNYSTSITIAWGGWENKK